MAHFIPIGADTSAKNIADIFFRKIVKFHGLPLSIVSDRDGRFTSRFWRELMRHLGTELCFSTAFHPQMDGQTEHTNCTLE